MEHTGTRIDDTIKEPATQPDALRLTLHLGKLQASDEREDIRGKLAKPESKAGGRVDLIADAREGVSGAAAKKLLGEDMRDGVKMIAKRL